MRLSKINFSKLFIGVSMGLSTLLFSEASFAQGYQMPPAKVVVARAEMRLMAPEVELTGTVISLNNSRISNEVAAPVVWLADVGTKVSVGDVIARMDDRLLMVGQRRAKANLKRLQADLVFREQDVARFSKLAERDNASKARLSEVLSKRDMLLQDIENGKAILDQANGDVARANIKAPFPGHVVRRLANVGEYLSIGKDVILLVDTTHVEIAIAAPLSIKPFLKEGALITTYNDRQMGKFPIRTIVPVGDQVSRMMEVRLSMPMEKWVVGTGIKVKLPSGPASEALAVPRDAVVLQGASMFVYKVGEDMKAEQVKIDVVAAVGNWVSFTGDIIEGDQVIIRGAERLRPGQSLAIDETGKSPSGN